MRGAHGGDAGATRAGLQGGRWRAGPLAKPILLRPGSIAERRVRFSDLAHVRCLYAHEAATPTWPPGWTPPRAGARRGARSAGEGLHEQLRPVGDHRRECPPVRSPSSAAPPSRPWGAFRGGPAACTHDAEPGMNSRPPHGTGFPGEPGIHRSTEGASMGNLGGAPEPHRAAALRLRVF